jgi:hypothetical protein
MLLIKYDGITNVCDAIKHFSCVNRTTNSGDNGEGYYYIDDDDKLRYTKQPPSVPYYLYTSTAVSKWNSKPLSNLPIEIRQLARKYVHSDNDMMQQSVMSMAAWDETDEGADFWVSVENYQFHKAFKYLANHNLLTDKTKDHETKLQDKTSSSRTGAEPKGSVISCKKSIATIASGHLEYGRGIRG